ncbi:MAG: AAA family ATPase [Planctomycetes bacterium]|nr:AAA family ATPase [Planctomycetota bacterium]
MSSDTADDHDWWTPAYQRAIDLLNDPIYKGIRIRVMGIAGCGNREPTGDVATLEQYAREIGPDAMYSGVPANGAFDFPIGYDGADAPDPEKPACERTQSDDKTLSWRQLSTIEPQAVDWLWPNRVANGKCNLFYGDGGVGKSFVLVDMMARITTGTPWPDCRDTASEPGYVILLNAEDDPNDTIRVRFDAQGGDPTKIAFIDGVKRTKDGNDSGLSLVVDLDLIEKLAIEKRATLFIIDPVTAYTGGKDIYKDDQVRDITTPLKAMAERLNMAVVLVMHTNKSGTTNAKHKAANSSAWINACRMAWMFAEDASDPHRRSMTNAKNNLIYNADGLSFSFDPAEGSLKWDDEPFRKTANQVLEERADGGKASKQREAEEFLKRELTACSVDANEIRDRAEQEDISFSTLKRAKKKLGVGSVQDAYGGGWRWRLQAEDH